MAAVEILWVLDGGDLGGGYMLAHIICVQFPGCCEMCMLGRGRGYVVQLVYRGVERASGWMCSK